MQSESEIYALFSLELPGAHVNILYIKPANTSKQITPVLVTGAAVCEGAHFK